jgi:hypothetical protein
MRGTRMLDETEKYRLPRPAAPSVTAAGFMLCPVALQGFTMAPHQQLLYHLALEQAKAVVRPSLPERDLAAVWN